MRIVTIAAAALAAALCSFVARAQTPLEAKKPADAPKVYVPGLEQFMGVIQRQHEKLWFAGQARNWDLAAYQLGEIKEVMGDVQELVPTFKNLPLDKMLDAVITGPIAELEKTLDAKDAKKFTAGFDTLTNSCNACHQATGNGFIVIQRPTSNPYTNQKFKPVR